MKRSLLSLPLIALALFFASCDDESDDIFAGSPSVGVDYYVNDAEATEAAVDDTVSFTVTASAGEGINRMVGYISNGVVMYDLSRNDLGLDAGTTSTTYDYGYTIDAEDAGETLTFTFVLVDDQNQTDTTTFDLEIAGQPAATYTATLLYAPSADGNSNTFYSIGENEIYSSDDVTGTAEAVSPYIDLGYYYGASNQASLASPAAFPSAVFDISAWTTHNSTALITTTMDMESYLALQTVDEVEEAWSEVDFTSNAGLVSNLEVGDIVAFETAAGLTGFIYVSDIEPGTDANDYIELEFLVATAASTEGE